MFPRSHLLRKVSGILRWAFSIQTAPLRFTLKLSFLTESTGVPVPLACQGSIIWMGSGSA